MNRFWHSRCLNNHIDLPDTIGLFASGTNASLVAKNGTKKINPLLWTKPSPVDRFWCLRCLNNHKNLPIMIESFAGGITNVLVAKIGTKDLATCCSVNRIWNNGQILTFKVSKQPYQSPRHYRIICKWCHYLPGGKNRTKKLYQLFIELKGLNSEFKLITPDSE